ncbi:hypothetical protein C8A00DRAFT_12105 [Chaetomidium leptoderma]|uniref:Uncharacterized protein n=1 Tax=Chaetomidium leptoderma TaxID=669021 RepID=A0AAN6VSJ5_9PEZI|nr:hypothetical protein C8A00DRAFT_12105 [Chaetomidium leptoderma]
MTTTTTTTTTPPLPPSPQARLTYLYQDLTRLSQIASPHIILHPADRNLSSSSPTPRSPPPLTGIAAAQQHEEQLLAATGGTLVMDVESITVGADGVFGCVLGVLRAGCSQAPIEGGNNNGGRGLLGEEGRGEGYGSSGGGSQEGIIRGRRIEMAFCGLWRFDGAGRAVEHWENAADPEALERWLRGE